MNVLAHCAFGLELKGGKGDEDDPFIITAKKVFLPPANKTPLILLLSIIAFYPMSSFKMFIIPFILLLSVSYPQLVKLMGESFFLTDYFNYFIDILEKRLQHRKDDAIHVRP